VNIDPDPTPVPGRLPALERPVTTPPTEPQEQHDQLREDIENLLHEFDGVTVKRLIADEIVDRLVWPELDRLRAAHRRDLVRNTNISQAWSDEVERLRRLAEVADNVIRAVCDALGCGYDTDPVLEASRLRAALAGAVVLPEDAAERIADLCVDAQMHVRTWQESIGAAEELLGSWRPSLPAEATPEVVYDGRRSFECEKECADGTCRSMYYGDGCGGCCGCLGGCRVGYEEQVEEAASGVPTPTPEPQPGDIVRITYEAEYEEDWNAGHNVVSNGWDVQAPPGSTVEVVSRKEQQP
jgi:hypothetical protein